MALSVLLMSYWVFRVPFFEEPDENAHADYAFALYTSEHLIRARDGPLRTDVHPYTRYLEDVSNFRGIRFNPDGRVPLHYGEKQFYRQVDAAEPQVDPHLFDRPGSPRPYVMAAYSFVFYGLEAAILTAANATTGGSLTAMLFAMRLCCALLMAAMLVFSYATMRELHLGHGKALLLTAAVGFFPLVLWHGAYVQEDNLACASIMFCLYLTLHIRNNGLSLARAGWLGLALALVSVAKAPYFAGVAFAVLLLVLALTLRLRSPVRAGLIWSATLFPSAGLGFLSDYFSKSANFGTMLAVAQSAKIEDAFHTSIPLGVVTCVAELGRAAWSTFGFGQTSAGFWHGFSWLGDLIEFGNFQVTFIVHAFIVAATLVTVALMVRRQAVVYRRLISVGRRRSIASAFLLFAGDPVLNSYFVVVLLFIGLDAFSNRVLSSNRYWVEFVTAAFLCGVWYAPRSLSRERGAALSAAVLTFLLAFSIISIPFWLRAINDRYYAALPSGHIHYETTVGVWEPASPTPLLVRGTALHVHGWAFDSTTGLPDRGIEIVVDGRDHLRARYGISEPAFTIRMHDDTLMHSGFIADIQTSDLVPGTHTAEFFALTGESHIYPTRTEFQFTVLSSPSR